MGRGKSSIPHGTSAAAAAPSGFDPTRGGTKCGAKKKQGAGHCSRAAGYNTDHPGEGRCHLHGGATPIKHGRYSKVKRKDLRELMRELADDPDPLDLTEDLLMMRALLRTLVDKKSASSAEAARVLAEVTKVAERMERIRNGSAISLANLNRVMHEMGRAVDALVDDPATRERIRDAWLQIRIV